MIHIPHVAFTAVAVGTLFCQFVQGIAYNVLFNQMWVAAMKRERNGDSWMKKDKEESAEFWSFFLYEMILNLIRTWITGLLLNLTQAQTISQAAQLGAFLFVGVTVPLVTSETMWEKRESDIQLIRYLTAFFSTVFLSCVLHLIGTA
ncbi:hypothetical protein BCR41DRAFT_386808 [Lobosporangium transversale]|uniref:Uncharacterized protein n=1 Tax=Lobosporangium transversale TaxID=64571 RepID=A0A1Y2GNE7_9FUNG|nr:hypothetical protein BCR41DRAFT_386808 [Lobosporangium transversale]ORZ14980.1 hypothetical protein BCR41DRAFT_386808 [Lobosporangium transversale]|eukprot:XP_021881112.1 hypothetical protein BCR41DRAFT_386808 [Lobosporangium transversale]